MATRPWAPLRNLWGGINPPKFLLLKCQFVASIVLNYFIISICRKIKNKYLKSCTDVLDFEVFFCVFEVFNNIFFYLDLEFTFSKFDDGKSDSVDWSNEWRFGDTSIAVLPLKYWRTNSDSDSVVKGIDIFDIMLLLWLIWISEWYFRRNEGCFLYVHSWRDVLVDQVAGEEVSRKYQRESPHSINLVKGCQRSKGLEWRKFN